MSENNEQHVHVVPAICTNCGAELKVDPTQEAAVCEYCGTPFIVEKAINKYSVENAHIDHVDNVHIDLKGSVDSVVGMLEREWDKSRQDKKESRPTVEERREEHQEERKTMATMMVILFGIMIVMMIVGKLIGFM